MWMFYVTACAGPEFRKFLLGQDVVYPVGDFRYTGAYGPPRDENSGPCRGDGAVEHRHLVGIGDRRIRYLGCTVMR